MAGFFKNLKQRFSRSADIEWDDLEEALIGGDLGVRATTEIIDRLKGMGRKINADDVVEVCREEIAARLPKISHGLVPLDGRPLVVLVAGVNGTGKTTSTAKLGQLLKSQGYSVMLAAADTFRAAAIEQLDAWAQRLDIPIVKGAYQADPSAVCFDAYQAAASRGVDFLLCDTAGRLHTRDNLMGELGKIRRVLGKHDVDSPHERFLVVDATTGGNALIQAREFHAACDLTGVIVTKLDGSGKGGIVIPIHTELGIAPRFIGTGESVEDFSSFNSVKFIEKVL